MRNYAVSCTAIHIHSDHGVVVLHYRGHGNRKNRATLEMRDNAHFNGCIQGNGASRWPSHTGHVPVFPNIGLHLSVILELQFGPFERLVGTLLVPR